MAKCECSNISIMQVFHELKSEFPSAPDQAVLHFIAQYGHNKNACRRVLSRAQRSYVMQSYPAASIAARRHPSGRSQPPPPPPAGPPPAVPVCEPHMPGPPLPRQQCLPPSAPLPHHPPCGAHPTTPSKHWLVARLEKACQHAGNDVEDSPQPTNHGQHHGRGNSLVFNLPVVHHGIYHGIQPGGIQPGGIQPGVILPGGIQPGGIQPGGIQPGGIQPGGIQPGGIQPGGIQPGGIQPGGIQPGGIQPGGIQPGGIQPGGIQPGGIQPGGAGEPDPSGDQYQVDVDCRVGRHRTALLLQPTPHYAADPARSYTSVNLTLRPPPPSGAPQPAPIDIQSAGSSLTYSSSSYDPRQGLQSQLQIRIGPAGQGSVSAMRTRVAPPSNPAPTVAPPPPRQPEVAQVIPTVRPPTMEDLLEQVRVRGAEHLGPRTKLLLLQQLERKVLLEAEVQRERSKLLAMQKEVQSMEEDLARRGLTVPALSAGPTDQSSHLTVVPGPKREAAWEFMEKTAQIREDIQSLQEECKRMTQEVDRQAPESLPLGETDQRIYLKMMRGHEGSRLSESSSPQSELSYSLQRPPQTSHRNRLPPTLEADTETAEDGRWTCHSCTFHNHELLESCEECEMPRLRLGTADTSRFNLPFQESFPEEPTSALDLPTSPQTDSVTQSSTGHLPCYNVPAKLSSLSNS